MTYTNETLAEKIDEIKAKGAKLTFRINGSEACKESFIHWNGMFQDGNAIFDIDYIQVREKEFRLDGFVKQKPVTNPEQISDDTIRAMSQKLKDSGFFVGSLTDEAIVYHFNRLGLELTEVTTEVKEEQKPKETAMKPYQKRPINHAGALIGTTIYFESETSEETKSITSYKADIRKLENMKALYRKTTLTGVFEREMTSVIDEQINYCKDCINSLGYANLKQRLPLDIKSIIKKNPNEAYRLIVANSNLNNLKDFYRDMEKELFSDKYGFEDPTDVKKMALEITLNHIDRKASRG